MQLVEMSGVKFISNSYQVVQKKNHYIVAAHLKLSKIAKKRIVYARAESAWCRSGSGMWLTLPLPAPFPTFIVL